MTIHKALYGSVALLRGKCPACGEIAFIIDGEYQCCGHVITEKTKEITKVKRMISGELRRKTFSKKLKEDLLNKQQGKCYWCGIDIKNSWFLRKGKWEKVKCHIDHYVAWVFSGNSKKDNLVASCNICNLLKGSKVFDNEEDLRRYLLRQRDKKGVIIYESS